MHLSEITPSLFASLGLESAEDLLSLGQSPHGREVLLLVDGLGRDLLERYAEIAPHLAAMRDIAPITTSFPSTTSTSLATLTTGTLPGTHGMLGYTVRVPRSGGRVLNALKWDERVDPMAWQPVPTLFERASVAGIQVTHVAAKRYEKTGFTRAVFRGAEYKGANVIDDLVARTVESLQKSPAFVYLYMNDVDVAGHSDGVGSEKWIAALRLIDSLVSALASALPRGTRLWLTADHGMINATRIVTLGEGNDLLSGVGVVAGEPRARHIYLSDDLDSTSARDEIASRWKSFLGSDGVVFTREGAIEAKLFGEQVTEAAFDRIGDIVAIARGGLILVDPARVQFEAVMIGHHGGDSTVETTVPLRTLLL